MRFDFTPRLFFAPQTADEAAALNAQMERLIQLYQKVDGLSLAQAQTLADANKQANTLTEQISKLEKELHDIVFETDYIYRSFQEQTAELKNQNNILKIGKSLFTDLTSIAQKLNNFQQGYGDLREKDFKKLKESLSFQVSENDKIVKDLKDSEGSRKREIERLRDLKNSEEGINKIQEQRLKTLQKEQQLYEAALDAQGNGIPLLQKELQISKQIYTVKKDLGGLANAAAATISKYGGSLAQFLDISEATEAVDEYNKKVIDNALKQESVIKQLKEIEDQKLAVQQNVIEAQNKSLDLLRQIKAVSREIDDINNLNTQKNELARIQNESSLDALRQKKQLILGISNSIGLEVTKQQSIIDALNRQISLKQTLENNSRIINESEAERIRLQNDLANGTIADAEARQQAEQRIIELRRIVADLGTQEFNLRREFSQVNDEILNQTQQNIDFQNKINSKLSSQASLQSNLNTLINDQHIANQAANEAEANLSKNLSDLELKAYDVKQAAIASTNKGLTGFVNKFKSLGVLINGLAGGLKKAFTDPVTIITFFIDKALEANKQAVEMGKSLAYGTQRANDFRESIADIARSSSNINVTAASLVEAFNELAQATGYVYEYSADQLETQIKLTKQVGLQADEAAQIQRFGVLNNKTSEETYKSFVRGLTAARNQLRVGINFKATLAEAAKVSGQLAAQLGNNPEIIAKAVVTAKAFGMTLEQVAHSGFALLNFEESISNELKAELLTGKQLNLERARAAALAGDQITLAEELAKNIGTSTEFTKMNVLQQKALAESVGMTADQLAETLRKREEAIRSGKSLAQINEEEARQALERQTIQDKFNAAILKLQDFIGNLLAGPVGELLDAFTDIFGVISKILSVFSPLFTAISSVAKFVADILSKWYILYPLIGLVALNYVPAIAAGFGGLIGTIGNVGASIMQAFNFNGIKGFFTSIKDAFTKGFSKQSLTSTVSGTVQNATNNTPGQTAQNVAGNLSGQTAQNAANTTNAANNINAKNAVSFKDKMKDIAAGLKAFANTKVLLGALNLIPASIGLTAMIPGAIGAKMLSTVEGEKVKEALKGIASGIKSFGNKNIMLGVANLVVASVGLTAMIPGAIGAKMISLVDGKKFQESMKGIAKGINEFGNKNVLFGSINLVIASTGLTAMIPGAIGAKMISLVDGKKFQEAMKGIAKGIESFGSLKVIGGALTLSIASIGLIAMIPGAIGAKMISLVDGEKFQEAIKGIAKGIESFGSLKVLGGAAALTIAAVGLIAMIPGAIGAKMISLVDGEKFQESMYGIAYGIEAFASLKVLGGSAALAIAAIGLTAMIPGALGAKIISSVDGEKFQKAMENIAKGIESFGSLKVIGGSVALSIAAVGLTTMIPGLISIGLISLVDGKKFQEAMKNIAKGIESFGSLGVIGGSITLAIAAAGLTAMIPGLISIGLISLVNGKKFQESMKGIAKGIETFGTGKVVLGSLLMTVASAGLIAMLPGVLAAKAIEKLDIGKKFKNSLENIINGIESFGTGKIAIGSLLMAVASAGLIAILPGVLAAKAIEKLDIGKKFKTSLENIVTGIEVFGTGKVAIGSLLMPVASVGLIAILPGALAAKGIEKLDIGKKFKTSLENIATGIEAFGKGKVLVGSLLMIPATVGLITMLPGALAAKAIEKLDIKEKFSDSLENIAKGISSFGEEANVSSLVKLTLGGLALTAFSLAIPGLLLLQLVNGTAIKKSLTGIGEGISKFSKSVPWADLLKGAASIALLGISILPAAYAFQKFSEVGWDSVSKGIITLGALSLAAVTLGKIQGQIIQGALAIGILGAALIPAAFAFQMFSKVEWSSLAKAGVALIGLGTAGVIFGVLSEILIPGAIAIAALGTALIPFALALRIATPAIEAFGNVATKVFNGIATTTTAVANGISTIFSTLQNVDVAKLLSIGPALIGIGVGLASLGGGGIISAIGSFLSGDPIEKLEKLAATGNGLQQTATALQSIATSLLGVSSALTSIDTAKLESLNEFASNRAKESVVAGITKFITEPIKTITETIGGTGGGREETKEGINTSVDLTPMIAAINEVKASIDRLYNKDTSIKMDGKKIGSTLVQGSYKVA